MEISSTAVKKLLKARRRLESCLWPTETQAGEQSCDVLKCQLGSRPVSFAIMVMMVDAVESGDSEVTALVPDSVGPGFQDVFAVCH